MWIAGADGLAEDDVMSDLVVMRAVGSGWSSRGDFFGIHTRGHDVHTFDWCHGIGRTVSGSGSVIE